jgi:hypothetical protein
VSRWLGLLGVLVLAAFVAFVVATRLRPTELEQRHALIRPGMTVEEVAKIMGTEVSPNTFIEPSGFTWQIRGEKRFLARDPEVEIQFDAARRVVRTSVNGEQRQP